MKLNLCACTSHNTLCMQCTCTKCWGHGIGHNSSWIRVKEEWGAGGVGGLRVKVLGQTPRGAGLGPAQCSAFPALN